MFFQLNNNGAVQIGSKLKFFFSPQENETITVKLGNKEIVSNQHEDIENEGYLFGLQLDGPYEGNFPTVETLSIVLTSEQGSKSEGIFSYSILEEKEGILQYKDSLNIAEIPNLKKKTFKEINRPSLAPKTPPSDMFD